MKNQDIACLHFAQSRLPEYHMIISEDYNFSRHRHRGFFEIDYVWEGALTETINNREYTFLPGTLIFIRENDIHGLRGSGLKLLNIAFSRKLLELSKPAEQMINCEEVSHVTIPQKARPGFEAVLNELFLKQGTPEGELLSNRFFYDVLIEWFIPQTQGKHDALPEWLSRGITGMESADVATWSVAKMVKKCCKSREHTARTFQAVFGCSISGYINRMKLEKARKELVYTNMTINDICFDSGFNNMNYFYRLFKKHFNATPSDYRRKHRHIGWGDVSRNML